MRVVIPVNDSTEPLTRTMLEWCAQMDERVPFSCTLAVTGPVNLGDIRNITDRYFHSVDIFSLPKWDGPSNWPQPQNHQWQCIAREMSREPWLYLLPDSTPLHPGWLDRLVIEYTRCGRLFMANVISSTSHLTTYARKMNGQDTGGLIQNQIAFLDPVAIYPASCSKYLYNTFLVRQEFFGETLYKEAADHVQDAQNLLAVFPSRDNVEVSFRERKAAARLVRNGYCIFHGCTDGSLITILKNGSPVKQAATKLVRFFTCADIGKPPDPAELFWHRERDEAEANGREIPSFKDCRRDIPSITEQVPWPCGFFPLKPTSVEVHFNCGLARNGASTWLLSRRWKLESWDLWHSDIYAHELDDALNIRSSSRLQFIGDTGVEQYEDPRVTFFDGRYWISACVFRHHHLFQANQQFHTFDSMWQPLSHWHVPYGKNGYGPGMGSGNEKNWVWFWHDGAWHFVYSFNPHVVVRVNTPYDLLQYSTSMVKNPWRYGEVRGGTPPVRVGDEFVSFFHSSLPWRGRQKRYYIGAYTFSTVGQPGKTFFRVLRATPEPILCGSEHDTRILKGPLVVFPCGALFDGNGWLVSMGVNDEACAWLRIPHSELERLLKPV